MIEEFHRPRTFLGDDDEQPEARACPVCQRVDATSKASSVARSHRGRFVLEDGTSAAYESELGGLLSRPVKPEALPLGVVVSALIVGWALLVLDFLIVAGLRAQTYVSVPSAALETASYLGIAWFGWLIPGIAIARYFLQRETVRKQTPRWREASQRWQTFHYCARDDVVYVPGEGHGVAPEHVALLYRPANPKPAIALKAREVQA